MTPLRRTSPNVVSVGDVEDVEVLAGVYLRLRVVSVSPWPPTYHPVLR